VRQRIQNPDLDIASKGTGVFVISAKRNSAAAIRIERSRASRSQRARLVGQSTRIDENRTDRRTKAGGNERTNERGRPDGRRNIRRGAANTANMANEAERRMEAWSRVLPGGANRRIIIL